MLRLTDLRRCLLGLIGPLADEEVAARFTADEWQQINTIAAQHRLQPHLHGRCERGELTVPMPAAVREDWRRAHRSNGLRALALRKTLLDVQALLAGHRIAAAALKGAWSAWHSYPGPAERPMRDIDLLLPAGQVLDAFALLTEHGFVQEEASPRTAEQSLKGDKHLPPLLSPSGVRIELHMRLWERADAIGWPMPPDDSTAMLARAETYGSDDTVLYLAPEDMLAHAIIHAVYSNRLNGGPLALVDIDTMLKCIPVKIDWPGFWDRARAGQWDRGAALMFHLVDRWCGGDAVGQSGCPLVVDPELLVQAPDLLLQDLDQRKTVGMVANVAAQLHQHGVSGGLKAATRRLRGVERRANIRSDSDAGLDETLTPEGFTRWLSRRSGESAKALFKGDVRRVARGTSQLGAWLQSND